MHIIESIYIVGAVIAICACIPQLAQLVRTKASDEFSLSTWMTWAMAQGATLMYVTSLGNVLMAVVNLIWLGFYATMSILIFYYRRRQSAMQNNRPEEAL